MCEHYKEVMINYTENNKTYADYNIYHVIEEVNKQKIYYKLNDSDSEPEEMYTQPDFKKFEFCYKYFDTWCKEKAANNENVSNTTLTS